MASGFGEHRHRRSVELSTGHPYHETIRARSTPTELKPFTSPKEFRKAQIQDLLHDTPGRSQQATTTNQQVSTLISSETGPRNFDVSRRDLSTTTGNVSQHARLGRCQRSPRFADDTIQQDKQSKVDWSKIRSPLNLSQRTNSEAQYSSCPADKQPTTRDLIGSRTAANPSTACRHEQPSFLKRMKRTSLQSLDEETHLNDAAPTDYSTYGQYNAFADRASNNNFQSDIPSTYDESAARFNQYFTLPATGYHVEHDLSHAMSSPVDMDFPHTITQNLSSISEETTFSNYHVMNTANNIATNEEEKDPALAGLVNMPSIRSARSEQQDFDTQSMPPPRLKQQESLERFCQKTKMAASLSMQKTFEIYCRQQPVHARMCGFGEKDRRPLDPPPVLQCFKLDHDGSHLEEIQKNPFLTVHATLWNEDCTEERNLIATNEHRRPLPTKLEAKKILVERTSMTRVLMGSLVASPTILADENGVEGSFFIFPDMSVRTEENMTPGSCAPIVAECFSSPFKVYSAKRFPGMMRSTELTKAFAKQGYKLQVRHDSRLKRIATVNESNSAGDTQPHFGSTGRIQSSGSTVEVQPPENHQHNSAEPLWSMGHQQIGQISNLVGSGFVSGTFLPYEEYNMSYTQ